MGASWIWLLNAGDEAPAYTGPRPDPRWAVVARREAEDAVPDPRRAEVVRR